MAKSTDRKLIGKLGEDKATSFLINSGFEILDRNFRTRLGEIDIIATKSNIIYCIEVKTRSSIQFGLPSEAITAKKLRRMRLTAEIYAQKIHHSSQNLLLLVQVLQGVCTIIEIE